MKCQRCKTVRSRPTTENVSWCRPLRVAYPKYSNVYPTDGQRFSVVDSIYGSLDLACIGMWERVVSLPCAILDCVPWCLWQDMQDVELSCIGFWSLPFLLFRFWLWECIFGDYLYLRWYLDIYLNFNKMFVFHPIQILSVCSLRPSGHNLINLEGKYIFSQQILFFKLMLTFDR